MSSSSLFRTPGTNRTKMVAQVIYGVGFGHSWYGWKDNFKSLPMALVPGTNSFEVDRNRPRNLTPSFYSGAAMPSFGLWALYCVGAH